MAKVGQSLDDGAQKMDFLDVAASTGGQLVRARIRVQPGRPGPPEHSHPMLEERFQVERGRMGYVLGTKRLEAKPGELVVVPQGTNHTFWNAGDDELCVVSEVRPALRFEDFAETIHVLIRDGRLPAGGRRANPLRLAVVASAYRQEWRLTRLSRPAAAMLPVLALVGRLAGYRSFYLADGESNVSQAQPAI